MTPQKHQAIRQGGWTESPAISIIFLVKSSKMQNLQGPNIEKVLLMITQRANTGGQGEIGTPALRDVPIFLKPTPNDS
jgi:hypothetical protein